MVPLTVPTARLNFMNEQTLDICPVPTPAKPATLISSLIPVTEGGQVREGATSQTAPQGPTSAAGQTGVERDHHPYGPSVLNYVAACPGFKSRGGSNEAAEDGTRLHDIMVKVLLVVVGQLRMKEGGVDITPSALEALAVTLQTETVSEEEELYLEFCCREVDKWLPMVKGTDIALEQRVYVRHENGKTLNFGHYDLLLFINGEVAILFDWKFGWIPVPPAERNWQGKNYAVGVFQKYPLLKKLGVIFVQPKLHRVTNTSYLRDDTYAMYREVRQVIETAQNPQAPRHVGPYCDYCALAGTCTTLINETDRALAVYEGLPIPQGFTGLQITNAEDAVKAMFVLNRLEAFLEKAADLKALVKDFARANNGLLSAPLPDGRLITVELKSRNAPRSADKPGLIAEVLKDFLCSEQVLGACDVNITTLEEIFANALVERRDAEAQALLASAEAEAQRIASSGDLPGAAQARDLAKREAKALRITKRKARELLGDMLSAEGLLSRPDTRVEYLKMRLEKQANISQLLPTACQSKLQSNPAVITSTLK